MCKVADNQRIWTSKGSFIRIDKVPLFVCFTKRQGPNQRLRRLDHDWVTQSEMGGMVRGKRAWSEIRGMVRDEGTWSEARGHSWRWVTWSENVGTIRDDGPQSGLEK